MKNYKVLSIVLALALVIVLVKHRSLVTEKKQQVASIIDTQQKDIKPIGESIDSTKGKLVNIGGDFSFFPTPVVVVGTVVNGKINWLTASNVGHMGRKYLFVGSQKVHYSNIGIKKHMTLSLSMVSSSILPQVDYVGMKSGKNVDKSTVFDYFTGSLKGAPLIKDALVTMECKVVEIMDVGMYDYFVLDVVNTYVNDQILNDDQRVDYTRFRPILFEMSTMKYIETGAIVGEGFHEGNKIESTK